MSKKEPLNSACAHFLIRYVLADLRGRMVSTRRGARTATFL